MSENTAISEKKWTFTVILRKFFESLFWVAILIFILDIVTKWAIQSNLTPGQRIPLFETGFISLHLTLSYNQGAAFGMGSNGDLSWRVLWILVSIILTIGLIVFYIVKGKKLDLIYRCGVMLMIGGAFGNMIDRTFYWNETVGFSGVIDWISFTFFNSYSFATFNIADSSLVIGVIVLIVGMIIDLVKDAIANKKRGVYDIEPEKLKAKEDASKEEISEKNNDK